MHPFTKHCNLEFDKGVHGTFFVFRKRSSICPSLLDKSSSWQDASFSAQRTSEFRAGGPTKPVANGIPITGAPGSSIPDNALLHQWRRERSGLFAMPPAPPHDRNVDPPVAFLGCMRLICKLRAIGSYHNQNLTSGICGPAIERRMCRPF